MAPLAESPARIDALGVPACLESSSPADVQWYEIVGFTTWEEIVATGGVGTIMWRPDADAGPGAGVRSS